MQGPGARPGLTTCSYLVNQPTFVLPPSLLPFLLSSLHFALFLFSFFPFSLSQSTVCTDYLLYTSLDIEVGKILITKCSLKYKYLFTH